MGTSTGTGTGTVVAGAGIAIAGVIAAALAVASSPALAFGQASSPVATVGASAPGGVIAWGSNSFGQVSVPSTARSGVSAVAAGDFHSLALKDGKVIAWGDGIFGQTTVPPSAQSGVSDIAACGFGSMALKSGSVIAWGAYWGRSTSVPSLLGSGVTAISGSFTHALALKGDRVIAWSQDGEAPVPPAVESGVTGIAAGQSVSLAIRNGEVVSWDNETGRQLDVPPSVKSGVTAISASSGFFALKDGAVIAWSYAGDLVQDRAVPDEVKSDVVVIADRVALKRSGEVIMWNNDFAQPGFPAVLETVPPGAKSGITAISRCTGHVLAIGPETAGTPGPVTNLKATPRKGALRVTWAAPADGTVANSYEYRVGSRPWTPTSGTAVTIKGKKGIRISVSVRALNEAGYGPIQRVSGKPK